MSVERCPECGGLDGLHGLVHVRHGNGGGHNEMCPRYAPELADNLMDFVTDGDEWGSVMTLLFAIADIWWCVEGVRIVEAFNPSPMLPRGGGRGFLDDVEQMLLDTWDTTELRAAFPELEKRRDALKAAGRDY